MSEALLPPQNQKLLDEKVSLLESTQFSNEFQLNFSFHGIEISFQTNSKKLYGELNEYIPSSWKLDHLPSKIVLHHSISPEKIIEFESESSSLVKNQWRQDTLIGIQRDFVALLDKKGNCKTLFEDALDDGLHNFFRWYLSPQLIERKKAMIHASVVLGKDHKAYVFLGPSGAGKTTVTSQSKPRKILSDDMNLLQIEEGKLYALAGGVGGLYKPDVNFDEKFEVAGLYWLIQSDQNQIKELSLIEQNRHMLSSFSNLQWESLSKEENIQILELSKEILSQRPLKALYFTKAPEFWDLLN